MPTPGRIGFWHRAGLWHLASLDAPTVAVVWSLGFAWQAHVSLSVWVLLLQALAVWSIYVFDRLLDVRAVLHSQRIVPLRERHRFHWRYRRILLPSAIVAASAAAAIVLVLAPSSVRDRDSVLAAAALVYFSGVHGPSGRLHAGIRQVFRLVPRELLVGVLFAVGCALPAVSLAAGGPISGLYRDAAGICSFAALAWLNCHLIERWETEKNGKPALRVAWAHAVLCGIAACGLIAAAVFLLSEHRTAALLATCAASEMLLAALDALRPRMTPLTLRSMADLVLLTPIVLICPR